MAGVAASPGRVDSGDYRGRMAKQLQPLPVRLVTPTALVDGLLYAGDGDFWDAWNPSPTGEYGGRRLYEATAYPMFPGAAPITSPVAAVNEHDLVVAAIIEPSAAARALASGPRGKHATRVIAIAHSLAITGTLHTPLAVLEADGKPLDHGLVGSVMTDAHVRSLDPAYPFEWTAPFAYLPARGKHVILRA